MCPQKTRAFGRTVVWTWQLTVSEGDERGDGVQRKQSKEAVVRLSCFDEGEVGTPPNN